MSLFHGSPTPASRRTPLVLLLLSVLISGSPAGWLLAESYLNKRVTVHFKDPSRQPISGLVKQEVEGKEIKLQIPNGLMSIPMDRVARVEVQKSPREEFENRFAAARTPDELVKLAQWCGQPDVALPEERKKALEKAITLDPDHAGARAELKQKRDDDGQWIAEEEYYRKKGLELVEGKWLPPDEAARVRAQKKGLISGATTRAKEDQGVPWAAARLHKSKNYILKCNSTESVARRYLQVLEKLNEAYSDVLRGYEPRYTGPGTVYVFRNSDEFRTYTMSPLGVGGFFGRVDRAVRAFHGSFSVGANTDQVLAHEATHQFQHRIMKQMWGVPYWLIEGMAVYFGDGSRIRPDKVELNVIPRQRLQTLKEAITTGRYVTLDKLLLISPPMNTGPCYDHGWGVIFWCLQGDNSRYKFGHKGEGKRIWKKYLDHVVRDIKDPLPQDHFQKEAAFFKKLITDETGKPLDKWEEDYKKFITNLPLEPLGKWSGKQWDGWNEVGLRFSIPDKFTSVPEEELHFLNREAAAATADGVRLWVTINGIMETPPEQALLYLVRGAFYDVRFEPELQEEEWRVETVNEVMKIHTTYFTGKPIRHRESSLQVGRGKAGPKGGGGAKKGKEAPKEDSKEAAGESPGAAPERVRVRTALFATQDYFYCFFLAGPDAPFSKVEGRFDEVLKSVKLNYSLHSGR